MSQNPTVTCCEYSQIYSTKCFVYNFDEKIPMDTHIELIHNEMLFKCLLCNKNLSTQNDLKNHHEAVHEGRKPYKCSILM